MSLSDFFRRRKDDPDASDAGPSDAPAHPTKVLARFLAGLSTRTQPVLLDLGPVVGSNLTFFGEQLGCKILVEDLAKDIDRLVREGKMEEMPAFFSTRLTHEPGSVDGILCWDIFDFLDRKSAQALAAQLTRILRPGGMLLALFSTSEPQAGAKPAYTRHVIVDKGHLQHRPYAAARGRQRPLMNSQIQRIFEPLRITEQFLLKSNMREVLFRGPGEPPATPSPAPSA